MQVISGAAGPTRGAGLPGRRLKHNPHPLENHMLSSHPHHLPQLRRHRRADGGDRRNGSLEAPHIPKVRRGPIDARPAAAQGPRADAQAEASDRSRAAEARTGACRGATKPDRRQDHHVRGFDAVRLCPHHLVRLLDRLRSRELPLRPADDDRLARGDLPFDLRDDQPEPRRREAPGDRQRAVEHGPGGGPAKQGAARPFDANLAADQRGPGAARDDARNP